MPRCFIFLSAVLSVVPSADATQAALAQRFGLRFSVEQHGRLRIAFRGAPAELRRIVRYAEAFETHIAPLFSAGADDAIQLVYFENKRTFVQKTEVDAFGFFSPSEHAIYSYARSGHGTLWHELMHAFIDHAAAHPPAAWFDEGLASFFEMGTLVHGRVRVGYTNWRQPILNAAIAQNALPRLRVFLAQADCTSASELALARFVFVYLWAHAALVPFVNAVLAGVPGDATRLLEELLHERIEDMEAKMLMGAKRLGAYQQVPRATSTAASHLWQAAPVGKDRAHAPGE